MGTKSKFNIAIKDLSWQEFLLLLEKVKVEERKQAVELVSQRKAQSKAKD